MAEEHTEQVPSAGELKPSFFDAAEHVGKDLVDRLMEGSLTTPGLSKEQASQVLGTLALTLGMRGASPPGDPTTAALRENGDVLYDGRDWVVETIGAAQEYLRSEKGGKIPSGPVNCVDSRERPKHRQLKGNQF